MSYPMIQKVSKNAQLFQNRSLKIINLHNYDTKVIPVENDLIICDVCNTRITTELVNLLMFKPNQVHSAVCEKCRIKYHNTLIITVIK